MRTADSPKLQVVDSGAVTTDWPPFRLMVGTPFGRGAEPEYVVSIWELRSWLATHKVPGYGDQYCDYSVAMGSVLILNRTTIVREAIAKDATHILFVDGDMNFTPHAPRLLMERHLPIVGCNYLRSTLPLQFTAKGLDGQERAISGHKIEEVGGLGFGMILIETEVFKQIPEPWFDMVWGGEGSVNSGGQLGLTGEDYYFCNKARAHGFKVMVDNEASSQIQHISRMTLDHRMVSKAQEATV